jgi:hypothetical protein
MRESLEHRRGRARLAPPRPSSLPWLGLMLLALTTGCGGVGGAPPSPVVVVETATPPPPSPTAMTQAAATPVAASPPATHSPVVTSSPSPIVSASPPVVGRGAAASQTDPAQQHLSIGRSASYRGLQFIVEEARSGEMIEDRRAPRGKALVGLRVRVHNPNAQGVAFSTIALNRLLRLKLPSGTSPTAEAVPPFIRPSIPPRESISGWVYFEVDRPPPLESLAVALGSGDETQVQIAFTGTEPPPTTRTFDYLRSTPEVRGLLWSVSGGEIRLDLPGQQANPGQEFVVLKVRATNPSTAPVALRNARGASQRGTDYLRMRADNGVLLQVSAELSPLPSDFPGKAEQDTLYAWQLPHGSKNPKLVILSPDGSEHELELGPLPPP